MAASTTSGTPRGVDREFFVFLAIVVGSLALFLDKAFTIDDPVYLRLGQHLAQHPSDFGGARMNWYGTEMALSEFNQNPPLLGYLLALAGAIFGWSEIALHAVLLVPAAVCAAAMYALARRLTSRPFLASIAGLMTPAFVVSSTNVMADTTMLAFWLVAIVCWIEGFARERRTWLWAAAAGAALAGLTKYSAIALVPLLFAHGLARERRVGRWALPLVVPIATWIGYELLTHRMYGTGLLSGAVSYASSERELSSPGRLPQLAIGLAFLGGSALSVIALAPLAWGWIVTGAGAIAVVALGCFVNLSQLGYRELQAGSSGTNASVPYQFVLMALGGIGALALAIADARRRRDADSLLLGLWVVGVFVFAAEVNWSTNARSLLPLTPAIGILLARRLEDVGRVQRPRDRTAIAYALIPCVAIALAVAHADATWANQVKLVAEAFADRFATASGKVYGTAHWGFQHYLEQRGIPTFDVVRTEVRAGDLFLVASVNSNTHLPSGRTTEFVESLRVDEPKWVHTLAPSAGAGFYASIYGPMPFSIGPSEPDLYYVVRVAR